MSLLRPCTTLFIRNSFSAGDTSENFANIPVVQEQLLVQATPRFVGSLPPVQEFTAYVARRPSPLVEVRPSERAQRHAVEGLGEFAPMVQILDAPVPQMVDYVAEALRLLDRPIVEQVIAVPTVSCSSCPSRSRVPEPQSADQLVEVPTVLTPARIAVQSAEQIVGTSAPRGRVRGFLSGQSSRGKAGFAGEDAPRGSSSLPRASEPRPGGLPAHGRHDEWVCVVDVENDGEYYWNRRDNSTCWRLPRGVKHRWCLLLCGLYRDVVAPVEFRVLPPL